MKKVVFTSNAPAAIGPYSQAIVSGDMLFLSGQLPIDPATGAMPETITEQTEQAFKNIKAVVTEAGFTMDQVVKTTVFLADMSLFAAMNEVYTAQFSGDYPARSAVAVRELPKQALVEIELIAAR